MDCTFCKLEIQDGQKKYISKQAGMKGTYHWECFLESCREANKVGSQVIETISVSAGIYTSTDSGESSEE